MQDIFISVLWDLPLPITAQYVISTARGLSIKTMETNDVVWCCDAAWDHRGSIIFC